MVREQIENVVYSLFDWTEGAFDFELRDNVEAVDNIKMDPLQFMPDHGLNPQFLAMEGTRIIDEKRHRGRDPEPGGNLPQKTSFAEESVDIDFHLVEAPASAPRCRTGGKAFAGYG